MDAGNDRAIKSAGDHTRQFDDYKDKLRQLFPLLPGDYVDSRSISRGDALALGYFLECYPRRVIVLDIGSFISASAVHLASEPKVLRVISVGPNPVIVDEIDNGLRTHSNSPGTRSLHDLRAVDVARAVLTEFPDEQQKIELRVSTVGHTEGNRHASIQESSLSGSDRMEIPALEPPDSVSPVALVSGIHTREGVQYALEAILEKNPHAIVILDGCRGSHGPFVQAGVVSLMEGTQEKYHFQLFGDLGPGIATSGLGIVYPDLDVAEVEQTLMEFTELFSERLDPLRLLRREEELIYAVNWHKNEADRYKKVAKRLRKRKSQLTTRDSNQLKATETPAESALRDPTVKKLARNKLIRRLMFWT
jgi:hypothetical protein